MSKRTGPSVRFLPARQISTGFLVREYLYSTAYCLAASLLLAYVARHVHGVWYVFVLVGLVVLHVLLTTDLLLSPAEAERITGYGLERRGDATWFRGYAPRRRLLRYFGRAVQSVDELDSTVRLLLRDGSSIRLSRLSPESQRLFADVFESLSKGASVETLKEQYPSLAPDLIPDGLVYRETPQLPRWRFAFLSLTVLATTFAAWKLFAAAFRW